MAYKKRFLENKILSNSFFLYLSHFADYILLLIFLPFIAHSLGVEEFGKISLAQTFGIFIILFFEFGSSLVLTREVSVKKENRLELDLLISKVFLFKLLIVPVAIIIGLLTISIVPIFNANPSYLLIVSIGAFFQGISPSWYFHGIEKMRLIAYSKFFFRLLCFLMIFFLVNSSDDGWIVLLAYSLSSLFICIHLIFQLLREIKSLTIPLISETAEIYRICRNSFFISTIPVFVQSITALFLSSIIGPAQLGYYYGASRIYRALNSLFSPIGQAFFPNIVHVNTINEQKAFSIARLLLIILTIFGILLFLILLFFSDQIVLFLLGKEYTGSSNILILFGAVLPFTAVSHVLGRQWLIVKNKDNEYMRCLILSSFVFFICFFSTINRFGAISFPISLIGYEIASIVFIISSFVLKSKLS